MQIEITAVKGFQDFLPEIAQRREEIERIAKKRLKKNGFFPLETPIIEYDEFMRPDVLSAENNAASERFKLRDKAGRNLGLRYEFAFQLSRILKQNPQLPLPIRRYQIGPVFRDEQTSATRFRQFTKIDIDIVGDTSVFAEAECLLTACEILKELRVPFEVQVSNKKMLAAIIESVEIRNVKETIKELDKINQVGEDMVKMNLKKIADTNQIATLFKMLEKDFIFFKDNAFDGVNELEELLKICKRENVVCKIKPLLTKSVGEYTGNMIEIVIPNKAVIGGGGRYDKLLGRGIGKEVSATGISIGIESIEPYAELEFLNTHAVVAAQNSPSVLIKLVKKLRQEGVSCFPLFENMEKTQEYAIATKIPFVIYLPEGEMQKGKFRLKNIKEKTDELLPESKVIEKILQIKTE